VPRLTPVPRRSARLSKVLSRSKSLMFDGYWLAGVFYDIMAWAVARMEAQNSSRMIPYFFDSQI